MIKIANDLGFATLPRGKCDKSSRVCRMRIRMRGRGKLRRKTPDTREKAKCWRLLPYFFLSSFSPSAVGFTSRRISENDFWPTSGERAPVRGADGQLDSPCCFLVEHFVADTRTRSCLRSSRRTFSANLCARCCHGPQPAMLS